MAEKKKILYIVEAMGGGVFTYIVELANELVNKYDMYIAYAVRKQTPKNYKDFPAPWWKTDYFEVRYENAEDNQRFFYQLDGEGIRYEIVAFAKSVEVKKPMNYVEKGVSKSIAKIIESFNDRTDMIVI